tara:strand:+ start:435 stop:617 length:183 start_codon:yes stop_codon:yes gene_type:complete
VSNGVQRTSLIYFHFWGFFWGKNEFSIYGFVCGRLSTGHKTSKLRGAWHLFATADALLVN